MLVRGSSGSPGRYESVRLAKIRAGAGHRGGYHPRNFRSDCGLAAPAGHIGVGWRTRNFEILLRIRSPSRLSGAGTGIHSAAWAMNETNDRQESPDDPDADPLSSGCGDRDDVNQQSGIQQLSDREWLAGVFRENEVPLVSYVSHLMHDRERACDVVQDAFVRLCNQPREKVAENVRQWLYRVCRNRALDVMKKEGRMKALGETESKVATQEPDPSVRAERLEREKEAEGYLEMLPKRQQEVIRLKVHSGLSYREISEITGLTVSNVGYLISTGLKSVRIQLSTQT